VATASVHIRPAKERDHFQINHVVEQGVMSWDLPERVKQLSLPSYYYHEHDFEHFRILVAESDKRIIGVVAWEPEPITLKQSEKTLLLHGLFVDTFYRKKSIGRRLFHVAEKAARELQCDGLLVRAQKDAEGFFIKMGMRKLDVEDEQRDYAHRYWKPLK
jgi:N-acetylglutamate synthase-like GNAT family acetyltransferase